MVEVIVAAVTVVEVIVAAVTVVAVTTSSTPSSTVWMWLLFQ